MIGVTRRSLSLFCLTAFSGLSVVQVSAQDGFYKGKTIRLIVGLAPGGGFDTYSRVIARHMGKHILGNPTLIVDNMPGAASLLAAWSSSRFLDLPASNSTDPSLNTSACRHKIIS